MTKIGLWRSEIYRKNMNNVCDQRRRKDSWMFQMPAGPALSPQLLDLHDPLLRRAAWRTMRKANSGPSTQQRHDPDTA
jgi:hypothetical protein